MELSSAPIQPQTRRMLKVNVTLSAAAEWHEALQIYKYKQNQRKLLEIKRLMYNFVPLQFLKAKSFR